MGTIPSQATHVQKNEAHRRTSEQGSRVSQSSICRSCRYLIVATKFKESTEYPASLAGSNSQEDCVAKSSGFATRCDLETRLSVKGAARRVDDTHKWTIHPWLSQGKLQRTKVGGLTIFRESDLVNVIEGRGNSRSGRIGFYVSVELFFLLPSASEGVPGAFS